jgi:glucoamylase
VPADRTDDLPHWIAQQAARSARLMTGGISATQLRHERPGFGYGVSPAKGSVLASPVSAGWDPEPDYFFHWPRDAAHVMHALTVLARQAQSHTVRHTWCRHFEDIVKFSTGLTRATGYRAAADFNVRARATAPHLRQFLRPATELRTVTGDSARGEPRFNPDGTISILRWAGPQYDGPAERANACIHHDAFLRSAGRRPSEKMAALIRADLEFTIRHAGDRCIGLWEEDNEYDHHYYTLVAQLGALRHGAEWADARKDAALAARCAASARGVEQALEIHWQPSFNSYKYLRGRPVADVTDGLDGAIFMAANHARLGGGRHSVMDDRMQATVTHLEDMFAQLYPINRGRAADMGLAYGRYRDDKYFSGGAYYFCTLGAAEFYYRLAVAVMKADGLPQTTVNADFRRRLGATDDAATQARALMARGDAVMRMVRHYTPADGSLAEQFDKTTGVPASARHLTWSYAAFITAAEARTQSVAAWQPQSAPRAPRPG